MLCNDLVSKLSVFLHFLHWNQQQSWFCCYQYLIISATWTISKEDVTDYISQYSKHPLSMNWFTCAHQKSKFHVSNTYFNFTHASIYLFYDVFYLLLNFFFELLCFSLTHYWEDDIKAETVWRRHVTRWGHQKHCV